MAEIIESVKWSLPQDVEVQAEVDAWFAGPVPARVVEAARKALEPAPEPLIEPEPEPALAAPGPDTEDGKWEWVDD